MCLAFVFLIYIGQHIFQYSGDGDWNGDIIQVLYLIIHLYIHRHSLVFHYRILYSSVCQPRYKITILVKVLQWQRYEIKSTTIFAKRTYFFFRNNCPLSTVHLLFLKKILWLFGRLNWLQVQIRNISRSRI